MKQLHTSNEILQYYAVSALGNIASTGTCVCYILFLLLLFLFLAISHEISEHFFSKRQ